jgi:polyferredoxin
MANLHRSKLLRAVEARPHRYERLRFFTTALSLVILFAIPLFGIARFDLWNGQHLVLGRPTDPITGGAAVLMAIAGFYLVTFLINAGWGRLFCGWGCPVGHVSRLVERTRLGRRHVGALLHATGFAVLLATSVFLWWVSPQVFVAGSLRARLLAGAALLGLSVVVYLHGRYGAWRFCQQLCPIGLYYSAVQTGHRFGIHFDRAQCTDCDACAHICPVDLDPRDLGALRSGIGGLALDEMPARNHCLSCGDCVRACELTSRKREVGPIALRLGPR